MASAQDLLSKVEDLITPAIEAMGFELVRLRFNAAAEQTAGIGNGCIGLRKKQFGQQRFQQLLPLLAQPMAFFAPVQFRPGRGGTVLQWHVVPGKIVGQPRTTARMTAMRLIQRGA